MSLKTTPLRYALALAAWFLLALNLPFLLALARSMGGLGLANLKDALLLGAGLYALLFLLAYLTAWPRVTRPIGWLLLLTAAPAACAVQFLDTEFSPLIIRSVFRTDAVEAREVLSTAWILPVLLLGVAPALLLLKVEIVHPPLRRALLYKAGAVGAVLLLAAALYLPNQLLFNAFADNAANHRLKAKVVPFNYLGVAAEVLAEELAAARASGPRPPPGEKLHFQVRQGPLLPRPGRHAVVILVLGESARARSFSLNGYQRETNPRLARQGVISFTRVSACATATAQAVPCLFSSFGEQGFSFRRAEETDNLLDVARQAGWQVTWFENGMGTQAVSRGVTEVNLGSYYRAERDRILIDRLPPRADVERLGKDQLIVLHQRGSHGPDYQQRYTDEFRTFRPDCEGAVLKSCTQEAVVNAYDNTILYTDANLDDAIEWLKGLGDGFDTALVYVSDHGESTGEGGWYMHGLPKAVAPDDQVRVPLIAWLSPGLRAAEGLDVACLAARRDEPLSHDNVFHSVVGLLGIETSAYQARLDAFAPCRGAAAPR